MCAQLHWVPSGGQKCLQQESKVTLLSRNAPYFYKGGFQHGGESLRMSLKHAKPCTVRLLLRGIMTAAFLTRRKRAAVSSASSRASLCITGLRVNNVNYLTLLCALIRSFHPCTPSNCSEALSFCRGSAEKGPLCAIRDRHQDSIQSRRKTSIVHPGHKSKPHTKARTQRTERFP